MQTPKRSIEVTNVIEWQDGETRRVADYLAAEEPLEIRLWRDEDASIPLTVTMRTPGHDIELAAGLLFTEGIISGPEGVGRIIAVPDGSTGKSNVVEAQLYDQEYDPQLRERNFFATSSCGICGKASIEAIRNRKIHCLASGFSVPSEALALLNERMRARQAVFDKTGGIHAAGLFTSSGELIAIREDIGRHNAVDKLIGWALLEGRLPLSDSILMVSGRVGFEIAQKSIVGGIPILASVSAPSSLAVKTARELGLTLIGFMRSNRFVAYSGAERITV